jgi:ribosomal protein S18 acetylase RimI-like enzyme
MTVIALPTLEIRRLDPASLEAAAALLHKVWHETYRTELPAGLRAQRSEAYFDDYLRDRAERCWVASMGRRLAGLVTTGSNCIDDLWVARRYRRRGVATRLVERASAAIAGQGFDYVQAGCEGFNDDAIALFTALGWQEIGSEPLYLVPGRPIEALVFARRLADSAMAGPA